MVLSKSIALCFDKTDLGQKEPEGNQNQNQGAQTGSDSKRFQWLRPERQQWGGEKWSNSGFTLQVELTIFADEFDAGDLHVQCRVSP